MTAGTAISAKLIQGSVSDCSVHIGPLTHSNTTSNHFPPTKRKTTTEVHCGSKKAILQLSMIIILGTTSILVGAQQLWPFVVERNQLTQVLETESQQYSENTPSAALLGQRLWDMVHSTTRQSSDNTNAESVVPKGFPEAYARTEMVNEELAPNNSVPIPVDQVEETKENLNTDDNQWLPSMWEKDNELFEDPYLLQDESEEKEQVERMAMKNSVDALDAIRISDNVNVHQLSQHPVTWSDIPTSLRYANQQPGKKYLAYQPSGGWGNQVLLLRDAVRVANALNRTLVVPAIGRHTNKFWNYNKIKPNELIPMALVLDIERLSSQVIAGIAFHNDTIASITQKYRKDVKWKKVRLSKKDKWKGTPPKEGGRWTAFGESLVQKRRFWTKEMFSNKFSTRAMKAFDGLLFEGQSLWACCSIQTQNFELVTFNAHIKAVALELTKRFGVYNAIHVRLGDPGVDNKLTISKIRGKRTARLYAQNHMTRFETINPVYVATDDYDPEWYQPLQELGYKVLFAKDLDQQILQSTLNRFPPSCQKDVLGLLEQVICANANRWRGTPRSTFSMAIRVLRSNPHLRDITSSYTSSPLPNNGKVQSHSMPMENSTNYQTSNDTQLLNSTDIAPPLEGNTTSIKLTRRPLTSRNETSNDRNSTTDSLNFENFVPSEAIFEQLDQS